MTRDERLHVILAPLSTWIGLMLLLATTVLYAYLPTTPIKPEIGLSIGIAKALLIALFFMQLRRSAGLVRIASIVGIVWACSLFLLTFADLLTR
jgi:cytochrome c oxidase subunit 4